jgi:hypothetical protein
MRGPGLAGFRVDMGEAGASGRIWNADEMVASRALNLPARIAGLALQRLVAMGTIEFEFGGTHIFTSSCANGCRKVCFKNLNTFCPPIAHVRLDDPITHAI